MQNAIHPSFLMATLILLSLTGCEESAQNALNQGVNAYKGDRPALAIRCFGEAIRLKPDFVQAYFDRGLVYATERDLDNAIADFSSAIRLEPDLAPAYNNRGLIYQKKGESSKADADFAKAMRLGCH